MKKTLNLIFVLALLASTAHATAIAPRGFSKTPGQIGDLYIGAWMGNTARIRELNNYLRVHNKGQDEFNIANDVSSLSDGMKKKLADRMKGIIQRPANGKTTTVDQAADAFSSAVTSALFQRSTCRATDSTIHAGDNGLPVATVTYACQVPNVKKATAFLHLGNTQLTAEQVSKLATAISTAPVDQTISGKFDLDADTSNRVWFKERRDTDSVLYAVNGAIYDFFHADTNR